MQLDIHTIQTSAVAVDVARLGSVCQSGPLTAVDVWVSVQALAHLVTDHVHQPLKHSLNSQLLGNISIFRILDIVNVYLQEILNG